MFGIRNSAGWDRKKLLNGVTGVSVCDVCYPTLIHDSPKRNQSVGRVTWWTKKHSSHVNSQSSLLKTSVIMLSLMLGFSFCIYHVQWWSEFPSLTIIAAMSYTYRHDLYSPLVSLSWERGIMGKEKVSSVNLIPASQILTLLDIYSFPRTCVLVSGCDPSSGLRFGWLTSYNKNICVSNSSLSNESSACKLTELTDVSSNPFIREWTIIQIRFIIKSFLVFIATVLSVEQRKEQLNGLWRKRR